jgi:hypothetical protein
MGHDQKLFGSALKSRVLAASERCDTPSVTSQHCSAYGVDQRWGGWIPIDFLHGFLLHRSEQTGSGILRIQLGGVR